MFQKSMRYIIGVLWLLLLPNCLFAQSYRDGILKYREQYIKELLAEKRQPVKPADVRYIRFFEPDVSYNVQATFTETPGKAPFMVHTHSGKNKPFREYGYMDFMIHDTAFRLHVYQNVDLLNDAAHKDDLFIPFNDLTNYETTFGGGRYIDLSIKDIVDGRIWLDFNKCYNPYCAYTEGFSCPIPPEENRLHIEIKAGEKQFEKYLGQ